MAQESLDFGLTSAPPAAASSQSRAAPSAPATPAAPSPVAASDKPVRATLSDPSTPAPSASDRVKIGDNEYSADELQALAQHKAAEDVRKASLPASPDQYSVRLPEDFKVPPGLDFKIAGADDPVLGGIIQQAQTFAHEIGLSQSQFEKMVSFHAATQLQTEQFIATARQAEVDKLGVSGTARVTAIENWLTAHLGPELAKPQLQTLATARHVEGWEKLIQKFSSGGGSSFSQAHRTAPDNSKIPGYEGMSFEQRRYAQDQRSGRR
jgi:hypothetical protein